jgi:DNA polymerase III subunit delta'
VSVWDVVVGQPEAVAELAAAARAAATGEAGMTHSWLITGPAGSGRSVAARAFAAALECREWQQRGCALPGCGQCHSCLTVLDGSATDVSVHNTEGTLIRIADARNMVIEAASSPLASPWRVLIIEDADRFAERTGNVLLKELEEPAERTVFVLCAPSVEDVLPTIRSRCRVVRLRIPRPSDVAAVLEAEGIDTAIAAFAARAAQGHIGRARRLATDEESRRRRREVLALPTRLRSVGECLAAAADLVEATAEEATTGNKNRDEAERAELTEISTASGGRGKRGTIRLRGSAAALKELEADQKRRGRRSQFDALDRALLDLAGWYRDVLATQLDALRSGAVEPIHPDQSDTVARAARAWTPEQTLRRIDAILDCRQNMIELTSLTPLLAMEELALRLRAG